MNGKDDDFSNLSLLELFRSEAESQVRVLTEGLLALDRNPADLAAIEPVMRAAHSLKGAARIVGLEAVERLAHVMEDCLVAAQKGRLQLDKDKIDRLLSGVDLITRIAALNEAEAPAWLEQNKLEIANLLVSIYNVADAAGPQLPLPSPAAPPSPPAAAPAAAPVPTAVPPPAPAAPLPSTPSAASAGMKRAEARAEARAEHDAARNEQVLKVAARNFDRLLALAGEARVAAHAMQPYLQAMQRFKKRQHNVFAAVDQLAQIINEPGVDERLRERVAQLRERIGPLKQELIERLTEFDTYERRLLANAQQMFDEVLTLRMRPFRDGIRGFSRMVRDLARELGKEVKLDIRGEDTLVDRDILARMESPLNHILRNAVDHGMEPPAQRAAAGKPREGRIVLEARHSAGMLSICVSDDGQGVDPERIRRRVVEHQLAPPQLAAEMSVAELLDFLFLPAFSLKETTSTVSGRGVGLDAVQDAVRELNGSVRIETEPGRGLRTLVTLPLSQSVVRAVIAEAGGEPYAIPLSKIERVLKLAPGDIRMLEDKPFFTLGNEHIGLIPAAQLLNGEAMPPADDEIPVIVIGSATRHYGLAFDAIVGEQDLAVQPVDAIFGKLRDVSAAALLDDGTPVLSLDIADVLVSIEKLLHEGGLQRLHGHAQEGRHKAKRILVVDDSLTVREMERKLLVTRGFDVDIAVDGMDGWNAVRSNDYDLVITDVDMPRMDGIELVTSIRKDSRLHRLPVMIVSYKDRPEDRARGIDAGADYYLTKGSFHDESLLEAVFDLIGESGK